MEDQVADEAADEPGQHCAKPTTRQRAAWHQRISSPAHQACHHEGGQQTNETNGDPHACTKQQHDEQEENKATHCVLFDVSSRGNVAYVLRRSLAFSALWF